MREDFIQKIKDYIRSQPDDEQGLARIKEHVKAIGATEDEFTEALREVVFEAIGKKVQAAQSHVPVTNILSHDVVKEGDIDAKFEEIRRDIQKGDTQQLSTFEKELAATKVELLAAFEKEMEKQRQLVKEHAEEQAAEDIVHHPIHNMLAHAPSRTITLLVLLFMGVASLLISMSITHPTETKSLAAVNTVYQSHQIVPHVFANSEVVDPERVFSFPATNVSLQETGIPKRTIFGFFPYWMISDQDKISLNNLTDISLFGIEMNQKGNIVTVNGSGQPDGGWQMYNDANLTKLLSRAKAKNVHVEYTLKMFDNTNIESLVRSNDAQKQFIANAVHIVSSKNLSGINLDFEYIGDPPSDVRDGFSRLIVNLAAELKRQVPGTKLTIDTYITSGADPKLFDLTTLTPSVDSFIVMGYDMHTPTGDPGPIAPMESEIGIVGLMQSYLDKVSADKLILAVPYYGYDWAVPKKEGEDGSMTTYAEIVDQSKSYTIQWDDPSQTPYYTYIDQTAHQTHEVHFENTRSLGVKYDFVNAKNLKGIGIWALGYDGNNTDLQSLLIEKFDQK